MTHQIYKYSAVVALASVGSVTLFGCKSDESKAKAELIELMNTAATEYERVYPLVKDADLDHRNASCQKIKDTYVSSRNEWILKYQDVKNIENLENSVKDDKLEEAKKSMAEGEQQCFGREPTPEHIVWSEDKLAEWMEKERQDVSHLFQATIQKYKNVVYGLQQKLDERKGSQDEEDPQPGTNTKREIKSQCDIISDQHDKKNDAHMAKYYDFLKALEAAKQVDDEAGKRLAHSQQLQNFDALKAELDTWKNNCFGRAQTRNTAEQAGKLQPLGMDNVYKLKRFHPM